MTGFDSLNEIWLAVYDSLGKIFAQSSLELWFKDIKLIYLGEDIAILTIDKGFKKEFIDSKYLDVIKNAFEMILGFEVEPVIYAGLNVNSIEEAEQIYLSYKTEKEKNDIIENQKNLDSAITVISPNKESTSYYTFDNFITGDSNKFAYAACYAIAYSDDTNYNPLFIHGKSGLGKTHLCYAIINTLLKRNPELKVVYIKGEEITL